MIPFAERPNGFFVSVPSHGLPPRVYLPFLVVFSVVFLGVLGYLVNVGFGARGSVFGAAVTAQGAQTAEQRVEGGPPPAVTVEWQALQRRVRAQPRDDVALTQLGDLELSANRFADAIAYYRRALAANPKNPAAREGLAEAEHELRGAQ